MRTADAEALTAENVVSIFWEESAGYKRPREVAFVEALSRSALGKLLEHEVREKVIQGER